MLKALGALAVLQPQQAHLAVVDDLAAGNADFAHQLQHAAARPRRGDAGEQGAGCARRQAEDAGQRAVETEDVRLAGEDR